MASNFAWGIDVGNRALKAVKLVREGDQLRVDDFDVIEHETVLSNAGDNRESLIQTALANFVQRHPFKGGQVAIGVAGQASFARFIKLPPVEPKKIPEIVRFEAIQQIPFPLDDVEWSYQLFQSTDSPDVEVGIFAMRKELVNQQIKQYTDVDLNVQVVQMNPLAVYNAMYYDSRTTGTTMIVDLGAENTDLIICDNESVWMRSIPIGGNNFTEALVKAFKLSFPKAEDLKRNAATSKYARQIFQAMRPIFADLVAEIQRSVGFYASVHRDSRIKKVLALGGTFKLPGLQKYLQQNLQLDVERLDTITAAPSSDSKLAPNFNENILSIVSAYGLAIQAMGQSKITSSLLPSHIRREKLWRQKTPLFAAAAALFVAGLGVSVATWWLNDMSLKNSTSDQAAVQQISSQASDLDTRWSAVESAGAQDRQTINNVKGLLQYRTLWPEILNDFYSAMPQANPAVIKAQPQLVSSDPAVIKQIPRNQRQVVMIDSVLTDYYSDITNLLSAQDITGFANRSGTGPQPGMMQLGVAGGGGDAAAGEGNNPPPPQPGRNGQPAPPAAAGPGAPRGFVMTIHCVTPFATGDQLVLTKVLPALLAIKSASNDHPYAIVKAQLVSPIKIKEDATKLSKMRADYAAALQAANVQLTNPGGGGGNPEEGPGAGPGGPNPGAAAIVPGGPNDQAPFLDRTLGESVLEDWEITFVVLVQLDPPPPVPGAAAPTPTAAPAAAPGTPQAAVQ